MSRHIPSLKYPARCYEERFDRFLNLMVRVRGLKPVNLHLYKVMDSTAFQDTETALQITLINETPRKTARTRMID